MGSKSSLHESVDTESAGFAIVSTLLMPASFSSRSAPFTTAARRVRAGVAVVLELD